MSRLGGGIDDVERGFKSSEISNRLDFFVDCKYLAWLFSLY